MSILELITETIAIETPDSTIARILISIVAIIVATLIVKITGAILKSIWMGVATKHDASALAYLGKDENAKEFGWAVLFPDSPRYFTVENDIIPYNDPRDVLGFVIGEVQWLQNTNWSEGYYAYLMINWQMYEQMREWTSRGYGIQKVAKLDKDGKVDKSKVDDRHLVITPFNEEAKRIVDICEGPIRVFRWQPYKKLGFENDRLDICTIAWQTRAIINSSSCAQSVWKFLLNITRISEESRSSEKLD